MLIVKIMSAEDTADHDTRKSFSIHAGVKSVVFERLPAYKADGPGQPETPERPWLTIVFAEGETEAFQPQGNVYLMNEKGVTVSSFGVAPIVYPDGPTYAQADNRLDVMIDRFLAWKLPADFGPDGGISFTPASVKSAWPSGTNLLNYQQAADMLRHVLDLPE